MVAVTTAHRPHRYPRGAAAHLAPVVAWDADVAVGATSFTTYRRRRLAAALALVALALATWAALGALGGVLTAPGRSAPSPSGVAPSGGPATTVVEVGPGDTLWTIAHRLQPTGDPRPLVDRLAEANGGSVVRVGARIALN